MLYKNIKETITYWATSLGAPEGLAHYSTDLFFLICLLVFAKIAHVITRRVGIFLVRLMVDKSKARWDDVLLKKKFFSRVAQLVPAIIIYNLAPRIIFEIPVLVDFLTSFAQIYATVILTMALFSLIDTSYEIFKTTRLASKFAIKGMLQALKIILFMVCTLMVLSVLTDRTPIYFLSGLGALTAVLMLIFKDVIMGLVAGIQLSANEMVREGDWIEMSQFGADGDVIDVSLTTVKVRNWDKTITSIPTYALISSSFKNWRGMQESGGRRIKRSIIIDMNSIKFCDTELIERLSRIQLLSQYIKERSAEIDEYNAIHKATPESIVNGRHMTNIGTFRKYMEEYLRHHPKIHMGMTFLVRHLQPTDKGLPIEIYVFSNDLRWAQYEAIQADILDHLLSAIHEFDLRVFQSPTGADFARLTK